MNSRIAGIAPSLIRTINARKRPGDLDLGLGEPTLPPDLDSFAAALEWTRRNGSPYSPTAGFPELREAIARYLRRGGWAAPGTGAEEVCVTVGSEEALFLALKALLDPARDEVVIAEPCYLACAKICVLEGLRHRLIPFPAADGFRPRAATLLASLRPETRLLVINSPANPTGRVWPAEELRALAEGLARHPHGPVHILADEVYRELYYGAEAPASAARYHPGTMVAGSLSKSNALTGLRLGWLAGPAEVIRAAVTVHQLVNTSASTFAQRVALELFADPARLGAHRPLYAAARERLLAAAERHGVEVLPPEGAFYGFVRLPPALAGDSLRAAERLLDERRVVTVPGRAFGDAAEGWLRISWAVAPELLEEAIGRMGDWFAAAG
jgi:aspartate/methionine/tyrosine aminotransferase